MQRFEFQAYKADEDSHVGKPEITYGEYETDSAAKAAAGRLAKRINGPVDVAFATDDLWNDRYITTASPSPYHAAGYNLARLD